MISIRRTATQIVALVMALLSIGGCVIICDGNWSDSRAKFERTVELQHPMPPGSTLVVSTPSGSIDVTGQDTDQGHVVATIQGRAGTEEEARELAEQVEIRFQESGDKLEIKADKPSLHSGRSISISYVIIVPRQTHIECESASGSLKLRDLTGNVDAHTASGSVAGERIKGTARLKSASGSVHCDTVGGGDVDLDTASGSVRLTDATAVRECRAHSASGSVHIQHVQADSIRIDSASGGVTGDDISCSNLKATSSSGHVSVTFSPSAPNDVVADTSAGSGGIHVALPPGFTGRVDLSAGSGSVHIDRPVTVQGDINKRHIIGAIGQGSGSLSAHTGSGSIDVR
jgi:DUF4097 and DUF4098 domain-containing protein YvlB